MRAEGLEEANIFMDRKGGRGTTRTSYNLLVGSESSPPLLRQGDVLTIQSLGSLGWNYTDRTAEWKRITESIGAEIRVLDIPLLDTTAIPDRLSGRFVKDLVFQVLCYVAGREKAQHKQRQEEGRAIAIAHGRLSGRPIAKYPDNWEELYRQWLFREKSARQIMEETGLPKATFYKIVKRHEEENGLKRGW